MGSICVVVTLDPKRGIGGYLAEPIPHLLKYLKTELILDGCALVRCKPDSRIRLLEGP